MLKSGTWKGTAALAGVALDMTKGRGGGRVAGREGRGGAAVNQGYIYIYIILITGMEIVYTLIGAQTNNIVVLPG